MHMPRHVQDDVLRHLLDGGRDIHFASGDFGFRLARGAPEQFFEALVDHRQAVEVAEVLHVQTERPVGAQIQQVLQDGFCILRFAIRGQAHQLVFARVDLESSEIRKRRIEQPQRVRETQLLEKLYAVSVAASHRAGRPLAHPVQGQNGRLLKRRRIEGARRMRLVMFREKHFGNGRDAAGFQGILDLKRNPQFLLQPDGHGHHEGLQPTRRDGKIRFQDARELVDGLVVKRHGIQIPIANPTLGQAVLHGVDRESRIVFLAGKPLLLGRGDNLAVTNQRRRGIVVERAYTENIHQNCLLKCSGSVTGALRLQYVGSPEDNFSFKGSLLKMRMIKLPGRKQR